MTIRDADTGQVSLRPDRPALLVSSTSWTPDEDFSLLLNALKSYDAYLDMLESETDAPCDYPRILCCITGEGPEKQRYEEEISKLVLRRVSIATMWLEYQDYVALLGAADLGVCLHTSSSGLDLPMKVVDMFGSGLPVAAVDFQCISELVRDDDSDRATGRLFQSSLELRKHLLDLLHGFPHDTPLLVSMRKAVLAWRDVGWDVNWNSKALPLLRSATSS